MLCLLASPSPGLETAEPRKGSGSCEQVHDVKSSQGQSFHESTLISFGQHCAANDKYSTWRSVSFQKHKWESALLVLAPALTGVAPRNGKEPSRSPRSARVACQAARRASPSWRPTAKKEADAGRSKQLVRETPIHKRLLCERLLVTDSVLRLAHLAGVSKMVAPVAAAAVSPRPPRLRHRRG